MLITRKRLCQLLGLFWLIDGILQLQPQMFTMNMVNGIMKPMLNGQPGVVESSLNWIVQMTTQNLILLNLIVAIVQILIGLSLLLGRGVKGALLASIVWAFIVWYGGEGMSMLLTGQASALTGAPGAVLLYALLALVVYPFSPTTDPDEGGILSRKQLRWALAIFWIFMALLQLQPYWWQQGQISQGIGVMVGQGGLNSVLVDPLLQWLSNITSSAEIPLNIALIVVFLALGVALFFVENTHIRPVLVASIVVSLILWYGAEAFGMILTGMATDFNSGLLLVVMALACWPLASARVSQRRKYTSEVREAQRTAQTA
ncbi:MAG: hypothetical protein ABI406_08985 [Ktedonobacteraceae bacterium]